MASFNAAVLQPITLTYFFGWGLAEQARWLLASRPETSHFTNRCLSTHSEFDALRAGSHLLFNQLPLLEIDGLSLIQSQALVRYLALRGGLAGQSPAEAARADMVAEAIKDCRAGVVGFPFSADKAAHVAGAKLLVLKYFPTFERLLSDDKCDGRFLASGLSYPDVLLGELVEAYCGLFEEDKETLAIITGFKQVNLLHQNIVAIPTIAAYLASDRRFPFPRGEVCDKYVANVNSVLGR